MINHENPSNNPKTTSKKLIKSKEEKIALLKKKQEQIKAKIQLMEAAEKSKDRKRETRRKILIGAYYLEKAKTENNLGEIKSLMDIYLKRREDRLLFDLPPLDN